MNEFTPAPVLPLVPWWERAAAGLLAVGWLGVAVAWHFRTPGWTQMIVYCLGQLHTAWVVFLAEPNANPTALLNSTAIVSGLAEGPWLGVLVGVPVLIGWAAMRALWPWRPTGGRALWWVALGHGGLAVLEQCSVGRYFTIGGGGPTSSGAVWHPWYEGWFLWAFDERSRINGLYFFPSLAELLLAVLVLWFTRKPRAKPKAAKGAPAT
jgi:hypothetical protein